MLQLIDISKQYRTGDLVQKALDQVSFSLRDNEFVAVLGPSGSGKTTLLNIIGGLDHYDSGDLIINGVSTKQYKNRNWDAYRNHTIGFVFQSYNLIPHQSVLANVELALTIGGVSVRERKKRAKAALEEVGLGEHIHKKPNQLSGGQMQRVAIARALVNDPKILLADEPTGALDSETSLQIMELLKKVASDRLVVMVTHNAELAQEYANRIITLRDGKITSDSNPLNGPEEAGLQGPSLQDSQLQEPSLLESGLQDPSLQDTKADTDAGSQNPEIITQNRSTGSVQADRAVKRAAPKKEKAGMSFLTSLSLSANNLRSKKGRTILISLASSIGIIGIALILSISTGVNDYILNIQKDTMSSYPLTISAQTIDLNGLMEQGTSLRDEIMSAMVSSDKDDGKIYADYSNMETSEAFSTSLVENNLTDFKKFLDDPDGEIRNYLGENGIVYTYDVAFDVFTYDTAGNLQNTDASVSEIVESDNQFTSLMSSSLNYMRNNIFSSWQSGAFSHASNFSELASGGKEQVISQVVQDSYELTCGEWPQAYNEIVIILNRNNTLGAETLYQLGLMDGNTYIRAEEQIQNGTKPEDMSWSYEDVIGKSYYLITASDHYVANEDGTFSYLDDALPNQETLMKNAVELKVTGIVRPAQDGSFSASTAVGYTSALTEYCIQHSAESPVITAQEQTPDINVLTGLKFSADTDEEKAQEAIAYVKTLSAPEKAQIYAMITYYQAEDPSAGMLSDSSSASDLLDMFGLSDNGNIEDMLSLFQMFGGDAFDSMLSSISTMITDESQQSALLDKWLDEDPDQEILVSLYDQYLQDTTYEDNMGAFGRISVDAPSSINIYTDTFEDKDHVTALIDEYNSQTDSEHQIVYTDYISLITTSMTSIVNAISYVLIAFVAISLIVSCIMIGIITHISVLERTKEIGILRAMGASRSNISHVFNAETVIIGLISGIFGILISLLLTLPINLILTLLLGQNMINVNLPVLYALLLIAISIVVTVIGGLIPAAKASKKDPVIALRSE